MTRSEVLKQFYKDADALLDDKCTWSAKNIKELLHANYVAMLEQLAEDPEIINIVVSKRGDILTEDPRVRIINRNILNHD